MMGKMASDVHRTNTIGNFFFYVLLTVHLSIILDNDQLDTPLLLIGSLAYLLFYILPSFLLHLLFLIAQDDGTDIELRNVGF